MKLLALTAATGAALLTPLAASADSASVTQTSPFISITGGKSHFNVDRDVSGTTFSGSEDRNSTGITVLGGYRWVVARPFALGVEAGYAHLGSTTWKARDGGLSEPYDVRDKNKVDAFLAGINGKWDLPYDLTITAHAGLAHVRSKGDFTGSSGGTSTPASTTRVHHDWSGNRFYGGVGFGYDYDENMGLTLSYDRYSFKADGPRDTGHNAQIGVLGLTAEYRFY
ncbi:outer membrane beta-barrel protein [Luteibacter flocculans]|uniref:Outer membrane beta-barrel protein n=1 Tax=Luteibacter flocculans TaxID=2780091 RepID=A0ABY4T7B3_9GAMM|nr:outer membrane beta-barrel protein [Luteibacter flocculans]URL58779.1 outer membrane beta-barrel protein [Luteibacter flocculans]